MKRNTVYLILAAILSLLFSCTETVVTVTSIEFSVPDLTVGMGEEKRIDVTVYPENAADKSIVWESSDPEIVSVDENGVVTGMGLGTATVTGTTVDGGMTAECQVTVTVNYNGHEYVDLGLGVKWATCNVGAANQWEAGDYFAWGETRTKEEYTSKNCLTYGMDMPDMAGSLEYDAARVNMGGSWRLPTKEEMTELTEACTWEWVEMEGRKGYMGTAKNGNTVFLPVAG